jgi:galactokinase
LAEFASLFGCEPEAAGLAPGRVNLLGEHTDYNEGYVLPAIVPLVTRVEMATSPDGRFRAWSENLGELAEFGEREPAPPGFGRYVHACVQALRERGHAVPALCLRIESSVPIGSGLSSSASLEVALLRGIRELAGLALDDVELALIAHRAESVHVGVRCGILDQMAVSLCRPESMLFLDTRTLERRLLPLPEGAEILVLDSGIPRELASTAYNLRRAESEAAAARLDLRALRDVTDVTDCQRLPPPLDRRARHVVTENARTLAGAGGVGAREFGRLMHQSHESLREDFEVSVPALDHLVAALEAQAGVYGARLTGAGFGGACVALVAAGDADEVAERALRAFAAAGHRGKRLA